jgi:hypothetical protein
MMIGTAVVLVYTVFGGMWSVALTDFMQMIIIVIGLSLIAWFASDLAGGSGRVIDFAGRARHVPFLSRADLARVAVLDRRGDHDHDRLDPATGRLPAGDVGARRENGGARPDHRRHRLSAVRLRADVYRAVGVPGDAGGGPRCRPTIRRRSCPAW